MKDENIVIIRWLGHIYKREKQKPIRMITEWIRIDNRTGGRTEADWPNQTDLLCLEQFQFLK